MSDVLERIRVDAEFLTVPLIVWKKFGRPMPGLVEDTYSRNPGLSELGPILPVGTEFLMKIEAASVSPVAASAEQIRLW
jgi:phage tail protein X